MLALVTGSTGFLGRHLVERLVAGGHRVRAFVYGSNKNLTTRPGIELIPGDITSSASIVAAAVDVDVIFHTAALVTNWAPWSRFLATTVRGTENVLLAASQAHVKRVVHISTVRVYDDRFCRLHRTVTEEAPLGRKGFRHFGHYARAKVLAEKAVWRVSGRLPVTVMRPAWIYGPGDEMILPAVLRFLLSPAARWPSRTDPCADPIYVTDVADCAIAAALAAAAVGQAYHVSPVSQISVREFLGGFCQALDIKAPDRAIPYLVAALAARFSEWWAFLTRKRSAPEFNRAGLAILTQDVRHSPAKAERELDWRPKVALSEGVLSTAAWLKRLIPIRRD